MKPQPIYLVVIKQKSVRVFFVNLSHFTQNLFSNIDLYVQMAPKKHTTLSKFEHKGFIVYFSTYNFVLMVHMVHMIHYGILLIQYLGLMIIFLGKQYNQHKTKVTLKNTLIKNKNNISSFYGNVLLIGHQIINLLYHISSKDHNGSFKYSVIVYNNVQ